MNSISRKNKIIRSASLLYNSNSRFSNIMVSCMLYLVLILTGTSFTISNNYLAFAFAFTKIPKSIIDERREVHRRPFFTKQEKRTSSSLLAAKGSSSVSLSLSSIEEDDDDDDDSKKTDINRGRFLLGLVALLYGTLNVSLRFVYDVPDIPPTAAALSATRGWIALACFLPPLLLDNRNTNSNNKKKKGETNKVVDTTNSSSNSNSNSMTSSLLLAGIELAVWNFFAQGFLNVGLLSTGSARASFLTQCSVLFTPLIATFIGKEYVGNRVWFGCLVALIGLVILTLGGGGGAAAAAATASAFSLSLSSGDLFVIGGALSWSIYLFRISILGPKHPNEIQLQGLKTGLVAVFYSIWWFISSVMNTGTGGGGGVMSLFSSLPSWMTSSSIVWIALFFSAIGPGTIADILQQKAQKVVSASEANVILSGEPVFATLFAVFLFGEKTSILEIVGGGLILCAALIATTTSSSTLSSSASSDDDKSSMVGK